MGVWGPPRAGKAMWVGFWGGSIYVGVMLPAGLRATWLVWHAEEKHVKI